VSEAIEQGLKKEHFDTHGLKLVARSDRYEIYDDQRMNKAIVWMVKGKKKEDSDLMRIEIPRPKRKIEWRIICYVVECLKYRSPLVPFVLKDKSMMRLAEYMYRYRSRSKDSLPIYAAIIRAYCRYAEMEPDELVESCLDDEGNPDPKKVTQASKLVDEFLAEEEANGNTTYTLLTKSARIKTFYKVNGIEISLPIRYSSRVTYRDRAPRPEEVQRLIEVADLREKAIISMLATGGFRISTLLGLKYRHVKEDLESGRVPLHIHVEAELNKGKVCDYDTFINEEAVHYLKLYLEQRRRGTDKIPPEIITDESPLFRTYEKEVKPLPSDSFRKIFYGLLRKAGLDKKNGKRREIRIHSLRKFFRTQMAALGFPSIT